MRLAGEGWLELVDGGVGQERVAYLSRRGCRALGAWERKPPPIGIQREHELAIIGLVLDLERAAGDDGEVLTERECRRRQAQELERFSVPLTTAGGAAGERWPDVVYRTSGRRSAIEIEIAPKTTARYESIVGGYLASGAYEQVAFLVAGRPAEVRLRGAIERKRTELYPLGRRGESAGAIPLIEVRPYQAATRRRAA